MGSSLTDDFEVVVVDDGGNGDLRELLSSYPVRIVDRGAGRDEVSVHASRPSAAQARNCGARGFTDGILVFVDSDVETERTAIERLTAPIREGRADATVGCYSADVRGMGFAQKYKHLYICNVYSRVNGFIRNEFWTALGAIEAGTFSQVGGFSSGECPLPQEDTELGLRLTQKGSRILAVPSARGRHLKHYSVRTLFLNDLRKGIGSVCLYVSRGVPVTDNRHASSRDVLAVASACGLVGLPFLAWALSPPPSGTFLVLAAIICSYLLARGDLLSVYRRQGRGFLARSIPLMWALDATRGLCMVLGSARVAVGYLTARRTG
jgi:cellulose synthase/poly-beta-1,6-N-acetylglucosamine synthase-like glycosyltransferase